MKRKFRVLVVDDLTVFRKAVSALLAEDPEIEVVGAAADGEEALQLYASLKPDVIVLDVEMPKKSGLDVLREIRKSDYQTGVVMFGSQTDRGSTVTLHALTAGASDYLRKPANSGNFFESREYLRKELLPKVKGAAPKVAEPVEAEVRREPEPQPRPELRSEVPAPSAMLPGVAAPGAPPAWLSESGVGNSTIDVVAIGVSTGGPNALVDLFAQFQGERLPVPILIVQHMPATFTTVFAERLTESSQIPVLEAKDGDVLEPGKVWLAPGDFHMKVVKEGLHYKVRLNQDPPENYCRPAVDPLFRSVADVYGSSALAVVLTGMGQDGMLGAVAIRAQKGRVIVQDEATSVVWGMPGAVVRAGAADGVFPLSELAAEVTRRVRAGR